LSTLRLRVDDNPADKTVYEIRSIRRTKGLIRSTSRRTRYDAQGDRQIPKARDVGNRLLTAAFVCVVPVRSSYDYRCMGGQPHPFLDSRRQQNTDWCRRFQVFQGGSCAEELQSPAKAMLSLTISWNSYSTRTSSTSSFVPRNGFSTHLVVPDRAFTKDYFVRVRSLSFTPEGKDGNPRWLNDTAGGRSNERRKAPHAHDS
jgi:hypothetical protein